MRFSLKFLTALVAVSVAVPMGAARADDTGPITLVCDTTDSRGNDSGPRTVHIDLDTREVIDSHIFTTTETPLAHENHGKITRITDSVIAWKSYELVITNRGNKSLMKFPYWEQGSEEVVDRYTLTITSPSYVSRCKLQTRKI